MGDSFAIFAKDIDYKLASTYDVLSVQLIISNPLLVYQFQYLLLAYCKTIHSLK